MDRQFVELLIEESGVNSYAQYVQRAKRRAEQAQADYAEALCAYERMVMVLKNKLDAIYN